MSTWAGYKTLAWNVIKIICGALIAAGVMTPEMQESLLSNLDGIVGAGLAIIGIVDIVFRKITKGPMGSIAALLESLKK